MHTTDYIGFDVHKKTISFCVKAADGTVLEEGVLPATRAALTVWAKRRPRPWRGALEATLFSGWIYDHLRPYATELKVAHPAMLQAITTAKKKNDGLDAHKITDLLRCDLLPECYMAPTWLRELRRMLRYRNRVVQQAVGLKNRIAGLLMEDGQVYDQRRLHGKRYFHELLQRLQTPDSILQLLRLSRGTLELLQAVERRLIHQLRTDPRLHLRVHLLMSIRGVGEVLALTWALEIAEVQRFGAIRQAHSYCGLTSAQHNSAGKEHRGPISKQRNRHLQTILIEAAKLAPRWNPELAALHERELARGNRNRATLAVARKLVAYLMAVDRSGQPFQPRSAASGAGAPATAPAGPAGPEFSQA
ncbi:MAG: IS110 family transposase [bacterium]